MNLLIIGSLTGVILLEAMLTLFLTTAMIRLHKYRHTVSKSTYIFYELIAALGFIAIVMNSIVAFQSIVIM